MAIKVGDNNGKVSLVAAPYAFEKETVLSNTSEVHIPNPDDPYDSPEERAEGMFIGQLVNRFISDPNGFCSTYREWHIFCRGLSSGFRTVLTGKFDICPKMWNDEAQYYEGGQEVGYVARNAFIFVMAGSIGTEVITNYSTVLPFILKLIGMG